MRMRKVTSDVLVKTFGGGGGGFWAVMDWLLGGPLG